MILIAFLISQNFALALPDYCRFEARTKIEKRIPLDSDINYFIRSSPADQRVSFATSHGNMIVDLVTGEKIKVGGRIDPVLSPDGELMIFPSAKIYDPSTHTLVDVTTEADVKRAIQMPYYLMGDVVYRRTTNEKTGDQSMIPADMSRLQLLKSNQGYLTNSMAVHTKDTNGHYVFKLGDEAASGQYQSIGLLNQSTSNKQYRMIYESNDSFYLNEYNLDPKTKVVTSVGEPTNVCGKQTVLGSMPMINRKGDEFSIYSPDDDTTKIYSINRMNGSCTEVDQIPTMTGKLDFSPSGQKVAFHMDQKTDNIEYFDTPNAQSQLGVFIYDRKTKSLIPVEDKPDEDSYYPVFLGEDRIAFASATKPPDRKFFLNVVTVENSALSCAACDANSKRGQLAALLGRLYNLKCSAPNAGFKQSLTGYSKLTRAHCHAMLKDISKEEFESIRFAPNLIGKQWRWDLLKDVTLADLEPACETETAPINGPTGTVK